ncbi:MAG: TraR/DksA C4-type zinc finger protein [Thermodesulfovibrionales bacterium]|nr:TraR/DksA C4-type zinc finger protein [Thermodesulfovibrionales bacterium]MCG2814042.1 TraR/DksA C4-type zinc finger protein [Thermodesulfovibrionales bacterium]MDP3048210.1 TraR/DksA C4-type zinc finger protein [Thermodesulfovibrionales bacterium]
MAAKKRSKNTASTPSAKTKKPVKAKKASAASKKAEAKRQAEKKETVNESPETLRKLLIQKREQIVKETKIEISKYIKGETRQLVDTALDDGDWSVVDLSEDISLRQLSNHREVMVKIDAALEKLQEGTYGICEDCGGKINEERLKVLPFAIYCKDCQEKIEQLEAIEKERPI